MPQFTPGVQLNQMFYLERCEATSFGSRVIAARMAGVVIGLWFLLTASLRALQ
jgi:hypothetical protein